MVKSVFTFLICVFFVGGVQANSVTDYLATKDYWSSLGGIGGNGFDLTEGLSKSIPGDKISVITVSYRDKYISGIKLDYLYGGSSKTGQFHNDEDVVELDYDEYIYGTSVYWHPNPYDVYTEVVSVLQLMTNKRNIWLGKENGYSGGAGNMFTYNNSLALAGLKGKSGLLIDSLQPVVYKPLELEFYDLNWGDESISWSESSAYISETIAANSTSREQSSSFTITYSETNGITDSWSNTNGITTSMGVSLEKEVSFWKFAGVKFGWEFSLAHEFSRTVGEEVSTETTVEGSSTDSLVVPSGSVYALKSVVYHNKGMIPYTARYINKYDGELFEVSGSIEATEYATKFTQWLEIGYVSDEGQVILYDQYQDEFSPFLPQSRSISSSYNLNSLSPIPQGTASFEIKSTNGDSLGVIDNVSISLDDSNWVMSEEEYLFRRINGID
ncbi:jacalin-like lectin [Pseudoalteromonas phenolica]|uniref:Jacalin-type lectin domain-containing protein n=1 Tax=Pseudoalteromonas phenolica TaxID=161398 RepID=A0A0S2K5J3_9GAMM|nr:jacalin-like lectin [Pseudoalteromonas phenolica]ALO43767.1 hypothetical protein PP2015_3290 [Pseudoalteromonas phenolica]MBE0355060.1 hypothetical protein [Pseudoalteromonas phenolica O-BC30]RXE95625.1 hypothetical protein D9981_14770 [Pseudoalteromonas phenolica O-BC30]